jgi:hypothetical protein
MLHSISPGFRWAGLAKQNGKLFFNKPLGGHSLGIIKAVPGRKTDVRDAEWIADLLQHGLLRGSFIPDRSQRELQELTRYRRSLVGERAREVNRIQKVLEGANIKLASVDWSGAYGVPAYVP